MSLFDLGDGARLVGRLLVGEALLQFSQPRLLLVRREGMAWHGLAHAVEAQQVARDVLRALAGALLGAHPLGAAELARARASRRPCRCSA